MLRPSDLLDARWLRRLGAPLRAAHPRLYQALNRVRKSAIAGGEDLDAYQATAVSHFAAAAQRAGRSLEGARVLELGSDPGLRVAGALRRRGAAEVLGVNSDAFAEGPIAQGQPGISLRRGHAEDLPFAEGSFDHVFSVALLEHLSDLPAALREMHRVLRPGGVAFASFGPLWSSGKGHHVLAEADGVVVRHSDPTSNPLPDFVHLLLDEEQLRRGLVGRVVPALVEPIATFVHRSPYINRLFYGDYVAAFDACPLELVSFEAQRDPVPPALQRILELRHPGETRFDVTNAEVVLRKPPR